MNIRLNIDWFAYVRLGYFFTYVRVKPNESKNLYFFNAFPIFKVRKNIEFKRTHKVKLLEWANNTIIINS